MAFSAIRDYVGSLVHPSADGDEVARARHHAFILSHLTGGLLAFAALPLIVLARGGQPSVAEIAIMVWLVAPILAALDLSRNGRIERAQFISTASLAMLILAVAATTGGLGSFALIWLPVVVFEATFSGSRRVIFAALGMVAFVALTLLGLKVAGFEAMWPTPEMLPEVTALMAVLYAAALALRWDGIQRKLAQSCSSQAARYQLLAENATDVITCHAQNGAVSFVSPAAARLLGSSSEELQGRGLFERVHVADRPAYLTTLSRASQGIAGSTEVRLRRSSTDSAYGSPPQFIKVEMTCASAGPDGLVTAVTREIFERSDRQETPVDTGGEIARPETAKDRFLASMSHELRTPLNAIIGFSELLANEQFTDQRRRHEYAGLIHESGLHLLSVVNGILDMSRIDSGNFTIVVEPFDVRPVIDGCVQLFALKASSASVTLRAEIGENMPYVLADKRACKQILINLVSNAIKFTPPGGDVCVSAAEDAGSVCLSVSDTGVGIAAEDIPNLGMSFFQARSAYDRPFEGTGLGLSVVKGLVDLHSGSFEVSSEIGKGTCVSVRLPKHTRESGENGRADFAITSQAAPKRSAMG